MAVKKALPLRGNFGNSTVVQSGDNSGGNAPPTATPVDDFVADIYLDSDEHKCSLAISFSTKHHLNAKPFRFTFFENGEAQVVEGFGRLEDLRGTSKQGDIRFLAAAPLVISMTLHTKGANAGSATATVTRGRPGGDDFARWIFTDQTASYPA